MIFNRFISVPALCSVKDNGWAETGTTSNGVKATTGVVGALVGEVLSVGVGIVVDVGKGMEVSSAVTVIAGVAGADTQLVKASTTAKGT